MIHPGGSSVSQLPGFCYQSVGDLGSTHSGLALQGAILHAGCAAFDELLLEAELQGFECS